MKPAAQQVQELQPDPEQEYVTPPMNEVETVLQDLANAPRLPSFVKTRNVREQFQHAFELIGGIPRLAHWAHQDPKGFYQLYSKLIPAQISGEGGGPIRVELSWVNGRDTSGRSPGQVIDVDPT
jgi:hypothetical protein